MISRREFLVVTIFSSFVASLRKFFRALQKSLTFNEGTFPMTFPMSFPEKAAKLEAKTDQKVYIPFASKEE